MGVEWLEKLFLQILQMSLWGTYCVVAVMILRLLLKRQPKIFSYLLWLIVAFRLICPVSFESQFSGFQLADRKIAASQGVQNAQQIEETGMWDDKRVSSSEESPQKTEAVKPSVTEREIGERRQASINVRVVGSIVWATGMGGMLLYMLCSTLKLQKRLKSAVKKKDYYEIEQIESPFVFGIIRPQIYFPANLREDEITYILEHEQTHIRRKDYLIKLMAFFILSVHWFNPLVWLAFSCMTKDMEMSCDEAVLKKMGKEIKQSYSTSLLFLASRERFIGAGPLAFGETGVKSRVKNILNYRKPGFWGILAAIVLLLTAGLVLMSDPKKPEEKEKQEVEKEVETETTNTAPEIDKEAEKEKLDKENARKWNVDVSAPESAEWISDVVYNTEDKDRLQIEYYDNISEAKMTLRAGKEDELTLSGITESFDASQEETWGGSTANDEWVDVKVQFTKPEGEKRKLLVSWKYGENTYVIFGETTKDIAPSPAAKLALYIIGRIGCVEEGLPVYNMSEQEQAEAAENAKDLEYCITQAILSADAKESESGEFQTEAHHNMKITEKGGEVTVYTHVLYQRWKNADETGRGSYIPTAITFTKDENGRYQLKEYWIPKDGGDFKPSIEEKFPEDIWEETWNHQEYIDALEEECKQKAADYFSK